MCIVAIDYDGTITSDFNKAKEALTRLKMRGHYLVIWSSRNNPRQHKEKQKILFQEMKDNLIRYQIPYDEIDDGQVGKFHAQVYIDDKAIRFDNNWNEILKQIY